MMNTDSTNQSQIHNKNKRTLPQNVILNFSKFIEFLFQSTLNILGFASFLIFRLKISFICAWIAIFTLILFYYFYKKYYTLRTSKENKYYVFESVANVSFYLLLAFCSETNQKTSLALFGLVFSFLIKMIQNCTCENDEEMNVIFKFFSSIYLTIQFIQTVLFILKIDNILQWYWRQVFCGYWIMISILAGVILISLLFSLSTLEKLFSKENWQSPMSISCKKILFTWMTLAYGISLFTLSIKFLVALYDYLSDENYDVTELIKINF